jgi:hypothetical protein
MMVISTFIILGYMNGCTSNYIVTGRCYGIDPTLRNIFIRFGLILNLKMTTASAIVNVASKVCTPTDYISDWFSGLVPVNPSSGCVQNKTRSIRTSD